MLNLIKKFPKKRGLLPKPIKKIFDKLYLNNRQNFLSQLSERWLHFSINDRGRENKTLEIGAGSLNHLKYEINKHYDIIEPKKFLYKNSIYKRLVNKSYKNISQTPNYFYARIISCATLEHITDLPKYLYISSLKLKKNGYIQITDLKYSEALKTEVVFLISKLSIVTELVSHEPKIYFK